MPFGFGKDDDDNKAPQGSAYPAGGGFSLPGDDDPRATAEHASKHAGDSGDSDFFSNIISLVGEKKGKLAEEDIDEEDAVAQHQRFFGSSSSASATEADSSSLGKAAALEALKYFTSGGSGSTAQANNQSAFVGIAMAEASKLFDQKASQGQVSSGASKESAVQQAGELALKMYLKSQGGTGQGSSGGSAGGTSDLLGLASKFLK